MGTLSNKYFNAQAVEEALDKGVAAYDNMGQIELVYNGTDIRFNNEVVNFQQIVDYITTDARFCYMVYNNRVLLTSDMQLTGGTRYVFFETSTTDSGLSKNTVVKVYSADGTTISSISHSTIANENFNNKVSTIADNDKNSTVHYPSNKAVTKITDELKEDLSELSGITKDIANQVNYSFNQDIESRAQGWALTGNSGLCRQDSNAELVKYRVMQGELMFLNISKDTDGVFQWQSSASVPASGTNANLIDQPHTSAFEGLITVPEGANYLIVSQLISNTSNEVKRFESRIGKIETELQSTTLKASDLYKIVKGEYFVEFSVNAGSEHYSSQDKIDTPIKTGETFVLNLSSTSTVNPTGKQLKFFYADGSSITKNIAQLNNDYFYIADKDIESIGIYITAISENTTYTLSLSFTDSVINGLKEISNTLPIGLSIDDIQSGTWTQNGKASDNLRLRTKEAYQVKKYDAVTIKTNGLYALVSLWDNIPDSTNPPNKLAETAWIGNGEDITFYSEYDGYVTILFANGKSYNESTTISINDYNCSVDLCLNNNFLSPIINKLSNIHIDGVVTVEDLKNKSFVSSYNELGSSEFHVKNFAKLYKNIGYGDGFLFFTDMHVVYLDGWEDRLTETLSYIEQLRYTTPTSFVLAGGDWLGARNTQDEALFMISRIAGEMTSKFGKEYAMLVGNHDTNYQGYIDDTSTTQDGRLSQNAIDNTYSSLRRKSYFIYNAPTFDLYCFDTGIEYSGLITDYYKNQVTWFLENLLTNTNEHIAIALHIIKPTVQDNFGAMVDEITRQAVKFNNREQTSYNGVSYDFTNAKGKIAFVIGGHNHADATGSINGIPYIMTTNASDYGSYSNLPLDLIAIDWDNEKLYAYRCVRNSETETIRQIDIIGN